MAETSSNVLEQEIAQIEQQLSAKREQLEKNQAGSSEMALTHEKETLREVINEQFRQSAPSGKPPVSTLPTTPVAGQAQTPPHLPPEFKAALQELVNTAFKESIAQAVARANASGNAALIDAFHDLLVDQLYETLIERGVLKRF